jgi:hypothetical protein
MARHISARLQAWYKLSAGPLRAMECALSARVEHADGLHTENAFSSSSAVRDPLPSSSTRPNHSSIMSKITCGRDICGRKNLRLFAQCRDL